MQNYHFIGIAGIGMSALAHILLDQEISVSGSDIKGNFVPLMNKGARCFRNHDGANIPENSVVVYSSAISETNEEYQAALEKRYTVKHRSELLHDLMANDTRLLVTGSHGKTTTTAMLYFIFKQAGKDPSLALGSLYEGLNGKSGKGKVFIAEADESDGTISRYIPDAAIVTNLDCLEHVRNYGNFENLLKTMEDFLLRVKDDSLLFYCGDDEPLRRMNLSKGTSYGFSEGCHLQIRAWRQKGWRTRFDIEFEGRRYDDIEVNLPGKHNVLNAAAVFGLSLRFGISEDVIRNAFRSFGVLKRRLERKRDDSSLILIDDYAHHPREIAVTLEALRRAVSRRRIVAVCQPHRYTRVQDLIQEYLTAFDSADLLVVTDIYSAGEEEIEGISGLSFAKQLSEYFLGEVHYVPRVELDSFMMKILMQHDVCITLGAGDVDKLHSSLILFNPRKLKIGLIFGGKSCEHDISVISARHIKSGLEQSSSYDLSCIGINKQGNFVIDAQEILEDKSYEIVPDEVGESLWNPSVMAALKTYDCFIPILHGPYSEDGRLQGFFETVDKPYAGPDFRSATISMDKLLTKRLAEGLGIATVPFFDFTYSQWLDNDQNIIDRIISSFSFPCFLKTAHLGSSVGIYLVEDKNSLKEHIRKAFKYDFHLFVEESKLGCREIEFSFLGDFKTGVLIKGGPSERAGEGRFIDYNSKYGFQGQQGVKSRFDLKLPKSVVDEGMELADKFYSGMNGFGCCRLDFFLDSENKYWLSEVNPIPGMTDSSPFPQAVAREGIDIRQLGESLVIGGLYKHRVIKRHSLTSTVI